MKNEDIKKPFLGVKNVFVQENQPSRILLFLLVFSVNILGQIPINNFGHSQIIKTYPSYTKFTILDFNNDGIEDVFLFGNNRKNFTLHQGIKDSTYSKAVKNFFLFPIDDFKFFTKSKTGDDYYIFVSRNKRIVGLVSFTKKHTLQLLHKIELDSYPTSIKIVDLNMDDEPEALIYGNNFSGLTIVENKGFRLFVNKIIKKKIFTEVLVNNSNLNDYDKIILVDLLNNSLNFYDGTIENKFQSIREIEFDEIITKVKIINFNKDDFFDIAVATESGMEILLGDSVYSFVETLELNSNNPIKDFDFCNLNSDEKTDLLLLSNSNDEIIFDYDGYKDDDNFIIQLAGLADYKVLQYENRKKILTLSKKGQLNIFSKTNQWGNSFSFYAGGKPSIIKLLKNNETNKTSFAIYDEQNKSVNILRLDSVGNFNNIVNVPFTNSISNFIISPNLNYVIGYSNKDRLIEKISLSDFGKETIKHFVYADHFISYAQVDSNLNIIALELEDGNLYTQSFIKKGNSYSAETPVFIDSSVVSATLSESNNKPLYWKKNENNFSLYSFLKGDNNLQATVESTIIPPFFVDTKSSISQTIVSYISNNNKEFLYFPFSTKSKEVEINKKLWNSKSSAKDFFFLKDKKGKTSKLFICNKLLDQIIELQYNRKKNKFEQTKIIKTKKVKEFTIEELFGKLYFIYSSFDDDNISFQIISTK